MGPLGFSVRKSNGSIEMDLHCSYSEKADEKDIAAVLLQVFEEALREINERAKEDM